MSNNHRQLDIQEAKYSRANPRKPTTAEDSPLALTPCHISTHNAIFSSPSKIMGQASLMRHWCVQFKRITSNAVKWPRCV